MKRIMLLTVCLLALVATGYSMYPEEFRRHTSLAADGAQRVWRNVETNPLPVALGFGTFLVTVLYHKARGKSLRESLEVAATKVTVVTVPAGEGAPAENPVVQRAKARATRLRSVSASSIRN